MDRQEKRYILAAGGCAAVLIIAVIMTLVLRGSVRDGVEPDFTPDIPKYEQIGSEQAAHLLSAFGYEHQTAGLEPSNEEGYLNCNLFCDMLFEICTLMELDYSRLVYALPPRLTSANGNDSVSLWDFFEVYQYLLEHIENDIVRELFILKTDGNVIYDEDGTSYLWEGVYNYSDVLEGEEPEYKYEMENTNRDGTVEKKEERGQTAAQEHVLHTVKAICTDTEVLCILEEKNEPKTLLNIWLTEGENTALKVFIEGVECVFNTSQPLPQRFEAQICDITLTDGFASGILIKDNRINGKVLMVNDERLELEGYGVLEFADDFNMYKIYDELEMESVKKILVGYSITDFVMSDGKICAALIKESLKADNIRVVLHDTGYKSLYHETVTISADRKFTVERAGVRTAYSKGETVSFSFDELEENERIKLESSSDKTKFTIQTVTRSYGVPAYRGSIEVSRAAEGLLIINELSLEEYLYSVVPSEMPTSYGTEALKVQAVCARSYAYNQLAANRYSEYGAHVDDSVNCQVYNNIEENAASIEAVKETYGEVMQGDGEIVSAYYFSTSAGHTADVCDVWQGGEAKPYFTGALQTDNELLQDSLENISLEDENEFRNFIDKGEIKYYSGDVEHTTSVDTFDTGYSWYRWNVFESSEFIEEQILKLHSVDIGELEAVTVSERGRSGIIKKLLITGTHQNIELEFQTAVRQLFAPGDNKILREYAGAVSGMSLLPSAFCYFDAVIEEGILTGFNIVGGGYGHGCGMSQNGVKSMVESGYSYEEIIKHYYTGVSLSSLF